MEISQQAVFSASVCLDSISFTSMYILGFTEGSEDMSHIRVVELSHDANGSLGLSIAGGVGSSLGDTPIMVANLTSGGPAERSRKLKVRNSWAVISSLQSYN